MNTTEKFKKCLKNLRRQLQDKLDEYRNQKNAILRDINRQKQEVSAKQHGSNDAKTVSQTAKEITDYGSTLIKDYSLVDKKVQAIGRLITVLNIVINNFSSDYAAKYISLSGMIETIYYAYGMNFISIEEVGILLGLTIEAGRRFLCKSKNNSLANAEYSITLLQDYFAPDGRFKYNERVDRFKTEIERLETTPDIFRSILREVADIEYERKPIAEDLSKLLVENNRILQNETTTSSTLEIKSAINEVERVLDKYEQVTENQSSVWLAVSSAFDHEKAIKPLDIGSFLYAMVVSTIITDISPKAVAECLGMLVHIDYQNVRNTRFYNERHPKEVRQLLEYFNRDGSFKENPRAKDFEAILYNLMAKDFKNQSALVVPEALESMPKDLRILLEESNEKYRLLHAQERKSAKENAARERLSRYYDNDRVVEVPYNMENFISDLKACGFPQEQENTIMRHMNNRRDMRGYRIAVILDEEELQTYIDAKGFLETLSSSEDDYKELDETLKNLSSIADLLSYDLDKSEREYLELEKCDEIERLKRILEKYGFGSHLETKAKAFTVKPVTAKNEGENKQ